jgi:hypothetical protein
MARLSSNRREQSDFAIPPEIILKIAETRADWEAAFQLVQLSYERSGLAEPNPFGMRVTPYHLLPTTEVFVAQLRDEVICTVSLVRDGDCGLPMQSIYGAEVQARRSAGLQLAEVSCLADRRKDPERFFPLFIALSRLMVQCARCRGVDQLLVTVHPRHARFYRRYMAFEVFGDEKAYPVVCNNPAVAMCLDFARIDRDPPACYGQFFGEPLPHSLTEYRPMPDADRDHFRRIATHAACSTGHCVPATYNPQLRTLASPSAPSTAG